MNDENSKCDWEAFFDTCFKDSFGSLKENLDLLREEFRDDTYHSNIIMQMLRDLHGLKWAYKPMSAAATNSRRIEDASLADSKALTDCGSKQNTKHSNPKWEGIQEQLIVDGVSNASIFMRLFMRYTHFAKGVSPNMTARAVRRFVDANSYILTAFPGYSRLRGTNKYMPICVLTAAFCVAKANEAHVKSIAKYLRKICTGNFKGYESDAIVRLRNIITNCSMKPDDLFWMALEAFDCEIHDFAFWHNFIRDHERRRLARAYNLRCP